MLVIIILVINSQKVIPGFYILYFCYYYFFFILLSHFSCHFFLSEIMQHNNDRPIEDVNIEDKINSFKNVTVVGAVISAASIGYIIVHYIPEILAFVGPFWLQIMFYSTCICWIALCHFFIRVTRVYTESEPHVVRFDPRAAIFAFFPVVAMASGYSYTAYSYLGISGLDACKITSTMATMTFIYATLAFKHQIFGYMTIITLIGLCTLYSPKTDTFLDAVTFGLDKASVVRYHSVFSFCVVIAGKISNDLWPRSSAMFFKDASRHIGLLNFYLSMLWISIFISNSDYDIYWALHMIWVFGSMLLLIYFDISIRVGWLYFISQIMLLLASCRNFNGIQNAIIGLIVGVFFMFFGQHFATLFEKKKQDETVKLDASKQKQ